MVVKFLVRFIFFCFFLEEIRLFLILIIFVKMMICLIKMLKNNRKFSFMKIVIEYCYFDFFMIDSGREI